MSANIKGRIGKRTEKNTLRSTAIALATAIALFTAAGTASAGSGTTQAQIENPSFFAMAGDLVVVRPLMLVTTVAGAVVYAVSAPFSAIGGNINQAGKTLVVEPFNATFKRCLGCSAKGSSNHEL